MASAEKKAASPGHGLAANHYGHTDNSSGSTLNNQHRRLPAFGRELVDAQRKGLNVAWLCIALDWNLGRAFPRVVVPVDIQARDLDMRLARGLGCMIVHRGEASRALDIAEVTLLAGATECPIFDVALRRLTLTTAEVVRVRGLVVAA
jgi:hypothetical protein